MGDITKIQGGITVENFWEREAGGVHHKAAFLQELQSAVEAAREEWKYEAEDSAVAARLVEFLTPLNDYLQGVYILPDGELTRYRVCARCGGEGGFKDEPVCIDCGGRGAVHAEDPVH